MIELFILYLVSRDIAYLAEEKDQPKSRWMGYTVLVWIVSEVAVFCAAHFLLGLSITQSILVGMGGAVGTHILLRWKLRSMPDKDEDLASMIEQIGDSSHAGPSPQP